MRYLITISLLLFITCGYTQSTKFFGPESHETISDSIVNFHKKNKFGVLIGSSITFTGNGEEDVFVRNSAINSLPNLNLIFIKNFKKNMLFISPGIRTISLKVKSKVPFYKDLQVNQVQIELPIIYNIKLNKNISMNFGISLKGSIWGNFLGNYNITNTYVRHNEGALIQKEKLPSSWYDSEMFYSDILNISSNDTAYSFYLNKPTGLELFELLEFSLITGIDFILNKKNRINLSYRLDPIYSEYSFRRWDDGINFHSQWDYYQGLGQGLVEYREVQLQYLEINYIHLF